MGQILDSFFYGIYEQFSDTLRPERPPLSGSSGIQALNRAEQLDGYIAAVNNSATNSAARRNTAYLPSPHTVPIPIPPADPKSPWPNGQVIWMDPSAENGLPHTRDPYYICLPSNMPIDSIPSTLTHERIHVSQRLHPDVWVSILADVWSMKPWSGSFPSSVAARIRLNPDLVTAPLFRWKNLWVPIGVFKSLANPVLKEIDILWWNTESRIFLAEPPPGWTEFFGVNKSGEHAYELAAYILTAADKNNQAYQAIKPRLSSIPTVEV
jgi:hypothetical protein